MRQAVDQIIEQRRRPPAGRRWTGLAASVALHVALVVAFVVAPVLAARNRAPLEFVPVRIVPIQALGQPEPAPPAPQPAKPEPKPAPVPEEPKPKPKPEPEKPRPDPEERRPAPPSEPRERTESPPAPAEPRQRQGSALGSSTGTATFGAAIAGLDNPDFVYNYYIEQMLSMISTNWVRPPVDAGIEAVVHFRIDRRGEVSELELVRTSGLASFDLAGLRAVRLAAPLPPLPASYPHGSLGVNLVIR